MDKLAAHRKLIKQTINEYIEIDRRHPTPGVDSYLIADEQSDSYLRLNLDWKENRRVNNQHIFVCIRDGKIHIERTGQRKVSRQHCSQSEFRQTQ